MYEQSRIFLTNHLGIRLCCVKNGVSVEIRILLADLFNKYIISRSLIEIIFLFSLKWSMSKLMSYEIVLIQQTGNQQGCLFLIVVTAR